MKKIGPYLDKLIADAGVKQIELARLSDTAVSNICDVRKGRRAHFSPSAARRIADVLEWKLGRAAPPGLFEKLAGLPVKSSARASASGGAR